MVRRNGREGAFSDVGREPTEDLDEVFQAWDAVHGQIRSASSRGDGEVEMALERHLKHLGRHVALIEKLVMRV